MARFRIENNERIPFTAEEEKARDAEEKAWADGEAERKLNRVREERNAKLTETDWVVIKEREEGGSVSNFADWKKYRQELRDITNTYKSLEDVKWPTAPSE